MIAVDVPESISRGKLAEMLALIGITDLGDVARVEMEPNGITVTMWARHPDHGGRYVPPGSETAAFHTVHIPIM